MIDREPETYIARAKCGCIRGAVVDAPPYGDVASSLAKFENRGYLLERLPTSVVRTMSWRCTDHHVQQTRKETR